MKGRGIFRIVLYAALGLLLLAGNVLAYTISGTVTYPGGTAGRVYIAAGSPQGRIGTSIDAIGTDGSAEFKIRGVPWGSYTLHAYIDRAGTGTQHAADPSGTSATINITGSDVDNINIPLANPSTPERPIDPVPPSEVYLLPGPGGLLIEWDPPKDDNGLEIADSYNIYWSKNADFTPADATGVSSLTGYAARDDGHIFVSGLNDDDTYYAIVTAVTNGVESSSSPVSNFAVVGAPSGGTTVSGTINHAGTSLPAAILHVAIAGNEGVFFNTYHNPSFPLSYSVPGVQNGHYEVIVIYDRNGDGLDGPEDITNDGNLPEILVAGGPVPGVDVELTGENVYAELTTGHWISNGAEGYNLNFSIEGILRQPVRVTIADGPGISEPIDIGRGQWDNGSFQAWPAATQKPSVNDTYTLFVTYSDGTHEVLELAVTGVVDAVPVPVGPMGFTPGTDTIPTFSWETGELPEGIGTFNVWVNVQNQGYNQDLWYANDIPQNERSILYNFNEEASQPTLISGTTYTWGVSLNDSYGNHSSGYATFQPTTSIPPTTVNGFSPGSGPVGSTVDIFAGNLSPQPSANQVLFFDGSGNTIPAKTLDGPVGTLTVIVPTGARTGAIAVRNHPSTPPVMTAGTFTVTDSPQPVINSFSPATGTIGGNVTIYGSGFDQNPGATTVRINNVPVAISSVSPGQITVTIPAEATTGPFTVTTAGGMASSASNFTVAGPISFSGAVKNGVSGLSGIFVEVLEDTTLNGTTTGDGSFSISNIPPGSNFTLKASGPGIQTTYAGPYNSFSSITGRDIRVYTNTEYGNLAVAPGKGVITGQVIVPGGIPLEGATVSVTSSLGSYDILYDDGSGHTPVPGTGTGSNGIFYILGAEAGDVIAITAAKAGWSFTQPLYRARADAVTVRNLPAQAAGSPVLSSDQNSLNFGDVTTGTSSTAMIITFTNSGSASLTVNSSLIVGTDQTAFSMSSAGTNPCPQLPATFAPSQSCTIGVTFHPGSTGAKTATININSNDPATPVLSIPLYGNGIENVPYNLTVNINGSGNVTNLNPQPQFACSYSPCSVQYPSGTPFTLRAYPTPPSIFTGWSGACSGTADCVIALDSDKSVTANFEAPSTPHFTAELVTPNVRVVRGQAAEFVFNVDFRNGFTAPDGIAFSLSGNAALATAGRFTPVPVKRKGGVVFKVDTASLPAGNYPGTVIASDGVSQTLNIPVTLTVTTVGEIKFFVHDPNTSTTNQVTSHQATYQGQLSINVEAYDADGNILDSSLVSLSSDNPSLLGVYKVYFWGYNTYALDNGTANLVAQTPDGFTSTLPITIALPETPKVTSLSISPPIITNKQVGPGFPITLSGAVSKPQDGGVGWGAEGDTMGLADFYNYSPGWDPTYTTFGTTFHLDPNVLHQPRTIGLYLLVSIDQSAQSMRQIPLTIVNDPTYSAARIYSKSLAFDSYTPSIGGTFEFYDAATGALAFSRTVYEHGRSIELAAIDPGNYKIKFVNGMGAGQWFPNAVSQNDASAVNFAAGTTTDDIYFFFDGAATPPPMPSITGFSPQAGMPGTLVTIDGSDLDPYPGSTIVQFNGVQATISASGMTQLSVIVPDGVTTGPITVTTAGGTAISNDWFSVMVNGSCGFAHGTITTTVPTSGLCSSGTASTVIGTGPWTWSCSGIDGGTSTNCYAYPPATSHTVTLTATPGGLVTPPGQTVSNTGVAHFTITQIPGWHITSVTGCGLTLEGSTISSTSIITPPIDADCTVAVAFAKSDVTFKEAAYLAANPDVAAAVKTGEFTSGWQHYELFGRTGGRRLAPEGYGDFNEATYLLANPDVAAVVTAGGFANGWQHYDIFGRAEGRLLAPSGYANFHEEAYLAANPDLAAAKQAGSLPSGWLHYELFGRAEGRPLTPPSYGAFREQEYLLANPDVAAAVQAGIFPNGWQHYDNLGRAEGRNTTPAGYVMFSEAGYRAANPDVAAAIKAGTLVSGWQHYNIFGRNEGRPVIPAGYANFNEETYLAANTDVAAAVKAGFLENGWQHYNLFGRNEGRPLNPASYGAFSEADYLAANPDVLQAVLDGIFASGWQHYENLGKNEGRKLIP